MRDKNLYQKILGTKALARRRCWAFSDITVW